MPTNIMWLDFGRNFVFMWNVNVTKSKVVLKNFEQKNKFILS